MFVVMFIVSLFISSIINNYYYCYYMGMNAKLVSNKNSKERWPIWAH